MKRRKRTTHGVPFPTDRYITCYCIGCEHAKEGICEIYLYPKAWFRYGKVCPFVYKSPKEVKTTQRIGQQKSKRG